VKQLVEAFTNLINRIRGSAYLDEQTIRAIIQELQRALLKADVPLDAIKQISDSVNKRLREERPPPGIPTRDYAIYIIYQELVKLLGGDGAGQWSPARPSIIMLVGIEGSGKTTTAAKLAKYLKNRGYKVGLIAADVQDNEFGQWFVVDRSEGGVHIKTRESEFTTALFIGQVVAFAYSREELAKPTLLERLRETAWALGELRISSES